MNAYLWAVSAAMVWGTAAAIEKWAISGSDPVAGVWVRSLGVLMGAFTLTFFIPQLGTKLAPLTARSWTGIIVGGALGSVVGQMFFYRALKIGDVGRVASVAGSWPLLAFVLSVLFLNEAPTVRKVAGAVLVFAGVWCLK